MSDGVLSKEDAEATERVRRVLTNYASAWKRGDTAVLRGSYHDEFSLHYGGNNPLSGVHHGKDACLKVLAEFSKRTGRKLVSVDHILAGPQRGCMMATESFNVDGEAKVVERLFIYAVRDDKFYTCWAQDRDQDLIDRLLSAPVS